MKTKKHLKLFLDRYKMESMQQQAQWILLKIGALSIAHLLKQEHDRNKKSTRIGHQLKLNWWYNESKVKEDLLGIRSGLENTLLEPKQKLDISSFKRGQDNTPKTTSLFSK